MALFEGDPIVDITTPDGRTARVPASVAASLGLTPQPQQIAQAPALPPSVVPAAPQPAPMTAPPLGEPDALSGVGERLPASVVDQIAAGDPPAPETPIQNSPDFNAPLSPELEAAAKAPKQAKQPKAPKQPAQMSPDDQLRATGVGGALAEQRAALAEQASAAMRSAGVEAAGHAEISAAQRARNEEMNELFARRQREAEADAAAIAQKTAAMETLRSKIANTKIDRRIDHPILAAISLALSGIGSAMKREGTVPALETLWQTIDRKVAGQMQDLEQQGKVLGLMKDEVAQLRQNASDRLALNNLLVSAEGEKAARYIEEIMSRTSSEAVKARGAEMVAQIRERAAGLTMAAVQAQQQHDQRERFQRQEMGFKYSSLRENARQHDNEMQFKREQLYIDQQRAIADAQARRGEAEAKLLLEFQKENEARGISNVQTGERLLTQAGHDMMAQADKLEEQAKTIRAKGALDANDAARVQMLEQRASQIRGEASIRHAFRHRDPTQAGKLSDKYSAGQTVMTLVDDIRALYDDNGRAYFKTDEGQAAIQAKTTELLMALKNAWALGVLSKQDTALIEKATGGDPTKGWDTGNMAHVLGLGVGTDPEAFKARLNSIAQGLKAQTYNDLRIAGWDVKDPEKLFASKTKPVDTEAKKAIGELGKPTTTELADDQRSIGTVGDVTQRVFYRPGFISKEDAARRIEDSGSLRYFGLTKPQEKAMDTLVGELRKGGDAAAEAARLLTTQALSNRTDVAVAAAQVLQQHAPAQYEAVRRQLPLDSPTAKRLDFKGVETPETRRQDAALARAVAERTVLVQTPVIQLGPQAVAGDKAAFDELSRRASEGDASARTVLDNVIRIRGQRR